MRCTLVLLAFWVSIALGHCAFAGETPAPQCGLADDAKAPQPFAFKGVTPGTTTERDLLANKNWGPPKKQQKLEDGAARIEFALRGYEQVSVTIRGGLVQTIDVALPQGSKSEDVALALKLGEPLPDAALPPAAQIGVEIPSSWPGVLYSGGCAALFSEQSGGPVRLLRVFAPKVIQAATATDNPAAAGGDQPALALQGAGKDAPVIVKAVIASMEARHLSGHPVDDEIARRMLTVMLQDLDVSKFYFTQADVEPFRGKQDDLDDQLRRGDLGLVYDLYKLYLRRLEERVTLAETLLGEAHDFSVDEELLYSSDQEHPENDLEIREIWRKRVKHQLLVHMAAGAELEEARKLARRQFRDSLERARRTSDDDVLSFAMNALTAAYDPQSSYMSARAYEDFLTQTRAQLVGIGASLRSTDGYVTVTKVIPGGPAARDGRLREGDRIIAVGQEEAAGELTPVIAVPLSDAVTMIRGKDGTTLRLRVLPKSAFEAKVYKLTRGKVELERAASTVLTGQQLPQGRAAKVGYVYLPSFYGAIGAAAAGAPESPSASADVRRALEDFRKNNIDVVVLDLRNNPGGTLTQSLDVAALFVGNGTTMRAAGRDGEVKDYGMPQGKIAWEGPLVVLSSKVSAAGSEIVAGAVQDYRRGLVIGDSKTNGLATVQNLEEVKRPAGAGGESAPGLGHVKATRERQYRPSGKSSQLVGVEPDIVLPSLTEKTEGQEAALFALQADDIGPAEFQAMNYGIDDGHVRDLTAKSEARRGESPYFQKLAEAAKAKPAGPGQRRINLHKEKFLADQREQPGTEDHTPDGTASIPGVPEIKQDGYLAEALAIALDHLSARQLAAGNVEYQARRFAEARKKYEAAIAADPASASAHYQLGWLLATCTQRPLRDGKTAVKHAQRACDLDPSGSWSYVLALAIAHAQAGDFESALKHLKSALEKAPEDQRAKYQYLEQQFRNRQAF